MSEKKRQPENNKKTCRPLLFPPCLKIARLMSKWLCLTRAIDTIKFPRGTRSIMLLVSQTGTKPIANSRPGHLAES